MLLFGQFVYIFAVSPRREPAPGFRYAVAACLLAAFVTAILWVLLEAPRMSGMAYPQALQVEILSTIVTQTRFGNIALLRLVLLSALAMVLFRKGGFAFGAALAAILLLPIAASGHAAAESHAPGFL